MLTELRTIDRRDRNPAEQSGRYVADPLGNQLAAGRRMCAAADRACRPLPGSAASPARPRRRSSGRRCRSPGCSTARNRATRRSSRKPARLSATGTCTRCLAPITQRPPSCASSMLIATPSSTTTSCGGTTDFFSGFDRSQSTSKAIDASPITIGARMNVRRTAGQFGERVLVVGLVERHFAFGIGVVPSKCGICFRSESRRSPPAAP